MEEWKKIDGYENYSVSCLGNVRNDLTGRILKPRLRCGYPSVQLGRNNNKLVHRLVATAFCENENGYDIVDHIDRHSTNNHYLNLRWTTQSNNNRNRKKNRGSSRYLGVSYNTSRRKWRATIMINGTTYFLGSFETELEARDAFRQAVADNNLQDFYPDDAEESLENNINP